MKLHARLASITVLAAAASLAGCATHSGTLLPSPSQAGAQHIASLATPLVALPEAVPPNCKGQKTTQQYASDTEKLRITGGSLCIPAFGALGGSITYPPANPSVSVSLISSTTNYNKKLPQLGNGAPIFYLQIALTKGTAFGQNAKAGGGLTGKTIKPGNTYTAYAQAKILGFPVNFTPCYAVATKGKYGGVIGGIGSLLKGQSVPNNTSGVIEIYSGKSANAKC